MNKYRLYCYFLHLNIINSDAEKYTFLLRYK